MRLSVRVMGLTLLILCIATGVTWYAVYREDRGGVLAVSFLAVGQGEAVFIDAPSGRQVLIDGGPDGSVLRRLGAVMPPWDRSLDVVIATSADTDDVSGLVDVLQRYSVGTVLQTSVENTGSVWNLFEKEAGDLIARGTRVTTARRGQILDLGKGAYLEILFPDRAAADVAPEEGCVIARLVYGTTSFLFACDAPEGVQKYLVMLDGKNLKSDVLLAGNTAAAPVFAGYVSPQYGVFSRACGTKDATVAAFEMFGIEAADTCTGTVTFVSDGKTVTHN